MKIPYLLYCDWEDTTQLTWWQIAIAFFIPSAGGLVLFHVLLPILVENGMGRITSWALLAIIGLGTILLAGIFLVRREANEMQLTFRQRIGLKGLKDGREWGLYLILLFIGILLALLVQPVTLAFMDVLGLYPPDYYPFILDPRINPTQVPESQFSPDVAIQGNFILIPLMMLTLLINILSEEIYFRGYLLPKMVKLGDLGWILNGVLFALYHVFQLWLFPSLLVVSLVFAFLFYKSRSLWVVFIGHFVGNFLIGSLGVMALVFS